LDRERHVTIVPTERNDIFGIGAFPFTQQIGKGHLHNSEHTSPASIGSVGGGCKEFAYVGSVGQPHEQLFVFDVGPKQALHPA